MPRSPSDSPTAFVHAYGCQMNKLDAELVASLLARAGYGAAASVDEADVILFCTCAVREHAEDRFYSNLGVLKRLKQRRPGLVIGVLGCTAQKDGVRALQRAPHVDIVCGTRAFPRIAEMVEAVRRGEGPVVAVDESDLVLPEREPVRGPAHAAAYVSVMRGCDHFCTYCIVPYVRGRETSRPVPEIEAEVRALADHGVREVTLLGQNVNSYGKSLKPRKSLADLMLRLDSVPGLDRLRFVTSHPKNMTPDILQATRDLPKVCEYLHMPAQSGSDRVLRDMRRGYTAREYGDLVGLARDTVPGVAIASDFIVGFPGETESEFRDTAALVRAAHFQNSFVFKYSSRPGTRAARLPDDVPLSEKKRRNVELLAVQERVSAEGHAAMVGRTLEVLVEGPSKNNPAMMTGRTRTNEIIHFPGEPSCQGRLVHVRVCDSTPLTLSGQIVSHQRS